uniref:protein-tyrosine-phosphatase n=1 Tax=Chromera velia CCMP2878 TaxID=1169474 RepID=A0A0G4IFD7_9ALVE|eukprot:Cvel_13887.t1-p1 / transcript=Cvel_13887.t1 / gene=Cvel_13887 / organism=Chromera_velia_CCMP2878 / gene_product=Dual specificity protein phosphatase 1, putative / transcript_product=Dual specificity protein phosphatase 1, putative / location=Cvel_scaffold967:6735-9932(-) / protein_length=228 / sequence_SO=supercontig / SO=protein_coding / is_pseudo=false
MSSAKVAMRFLPPSLLSSWCWLQETKGVADGSSKREGKGGGRVRVDEGAVAASPPSFVSILPGLWLGGITDAQNREELLEKSVCNIVNCCTFLEYPIAQHFEDFEYYRVDVEDTSREPIHLYFEEACDFIEAAMAKKKAVFVHCRSGVSRSVTVLISFLVARRGFRLQEAFFHVLAKREIVAPNVGFMQQLCDWEQEQSKEPSLCMYKYTDWYTSDQAFRPAVPDLDP